MQQGYDKPTLWKGVGNLVVVAPLVRLLFPTRPLSSPRYQRPRNRQLYHHAHPGCSMEVRGIGMALSFSHIPMASLEEDCLREQ